MPILKYKNPTTQLWEPVVCGSLNGGGAVDGGTASGIPITSTPSADTTVWIDPNENIINSLFDSSVKIATGKYIGDGTYGQSNPNSITFDFTPKLVIIREGHDGKSITSQLPQLAFMWIYGMNIITPISESPSGSSNINLKCALNEKTLSWYGVYDDNVSIQDYQMNTKNSTYYYFAIGNNTSASSDNESIIEPTTISVLIDGYSYSNIPQNITWYEFVNNNTLGKTLGLSCVGTDTIVTQGTGPSVPGVYNISTGIMVYGRDILYNGCSYGIVTNNGDDGYGDVNGDGVVGPGEGSAGGYV